MGDRASLDVGELDRRAFAVVGTCGLALLVSLSLVFYAQVGWLVGLDALGLFTPLSPQHVTIGWQAVLVVAPAGTVALLPAVVAGILAGPRAAGLAWLVSLALVAVTLGLHDAWYGPIYVPG